MAPPPFASSAIFLSGSSFQPVARYLPGDEAAYSPSPPPLSNANLHIDPTLCALDTPEPLCLPSQMIPAPRSLPAEQPMQRFLEDNQQPNYFEPVPPIFATSFPSDYTTAAATTTTTTTTTTIRGQTSTAWPITSAPAATPRANSPYASTFELASNSNALSPSFGSEPYYDYDTMPSTPGDQVNPYSRSSPQPAATLRFTGTNPVVHEGYVDPKEISSMCCDASDFASMDSFDDGLNNSISVGVSSNPDKFLLDDDPSSGHRAASLLEGSYMPGVEPQYDYMERGYTLRSSSSHDETRKSQSHSQNEHPPNPQHQFLTDDGPIRRMFSPEPMVPPPRDSITSHPLQGSPEGLPVHAAAADPEAQPMQTAKRRRVGNSRAAAAAASAEAVEDSISVSADASPAPAAARPSRKRKMLQTVPQVSPKPLAPSLAKAKLTCTDCRKPFESQASLTAHMRKMHKRPFTCMFSFAGCSAEFSNKNEWKRHIAKQHLKIMYWLCRHEACERARNSSISSSISSSSNSFRGSADGHTTAAAASPSILPADSPSNGKFNRKDLYIQHVRRMHMDEALKAEKVRLDQQAKDLPKPPKKKKGQQGRGRRRGGRNGGGDATAAAAAEGDEDGSSAAQQQRLVPSAAMDQWERSLPVMADRAAIERCSLPAAMTCPACGDHFANGNAWDEFVEHVGHHLQAVDTGSEQPIVFGGLDDTLTTWASRPAIDIIRRGLDRYGRPCWMLHDPLESVMVPARGQAEPPSDEEDGEGDDDDFLA